MNIPIYQIDAFTDERFHGNPAAVCILNDWLPDVTLQDIAAENNLAETAFVVANGNIFELRWFTPKIEVDLCGHATLATAYVYKEHLNYPFSEISFKTKSGILKVIYDADVLSMIFPRRPAEPCNLPDQLADGINAKPLEVLKARDYLVVLNYEDGSIATLEYFAVGNKDLNKEYMEIHFDGKSIIMDDYRILKGYGFNIKNIKTKKSEKGHLEELEILYNALIGNEEKWPIELWDMMQTSEVSLEL